MSGAIKKFLEVAVANFFGTEKDCQAKEILKLRVVFFGLIRLQRKKKHSTRGFTVFCARNWFTQITKKNTQYYNTKVKMSDLLTSWVSWEFRSVPWHALFWIIPLWIVLLVMHPVLLRPMLQFLIWSKFRSHMILMFRIQVILV